MKRAILFVILVFFVVVATAHAGQLGPPEPVAKEGKLSLGVGYSYFVDKWTPKDSGWTDAKITANQPYAQASYGLMKNAEAYLRLGAADLKVSPAFFSGAGLSGFKTEFSDGFKPFATVGVKGVFNITPSLGVGSFIQASLYSDYKDSTTGTVQGFSATQEMKVKSPWEVDLGVALQGKIHGVILYGGPVAYWSRADVEGKITVPGIGTATASTTYKEKNNFGGFVGIRVPLGKTLTLELEGQQKSEFSVGTSISYSF